MTTDSVQPSHRTRLAAALLTASLLALAPAAIAQFIQTGTGPYDYTTTSNWSGSSINGFFSSAPSGSGTAVQFGADTTLATALTFDFTGSSKTLALVGSGDHVLTLGGDITVNVTGSPSFVAIGSLTTNKLDVVLGANRTFTVNSGNTLKFLNTISGANSVTTVGPGTTIFAGDNTYSGGTTITSGTFAVGDGGATGSIVGNVANNGTLVFNRSGTLSYGGDISGTGALSKSGSGTLTLTGNNTYAGLTAITTGTLQLGASNVLPAATQVSTSSGATFDLNNFNQTVGSLTNAGSITLGTGTLTVNNAAFSSTSAVISGGGSLVKTGAGILALVGDNTYTGTTTISAGTLWIGNVGTTGSIAGNIVNNAALAFNHTNNLAYAGVISGTGSVTKYEGGTLTLSGANTYSGTTTVNGGTLLLNASGALNSGNNVVVSSNVGGTTVTLELGSTFTQTIGTLTLGGQNSTSTANVTLDSGSKLTLGGTVTFSVTGNPNQANINGPGTLDLGANRTFNIGDSSTTVSELNIYAPITGTGFSLTKTGAGRLALNGTGTTYSGGTIVNNGEFWLNASNTLLSTGAVTINHINGGTRADFIVGDNVTQTIGTLTFGGASATTSSDNQLELHNSSTVLTLGGTVTYDATGNPKGATISGPGTLNLGGSRTFDIGNSSTTTNELTISSVVDGGSITKSGAGTLRLSGANTYTGGTVVTAGGLFVSNTTGSGVGTGSLVVQAGGTLRGTGFIGGATTIMSGGIMGTGGTGGTPGTLTFSNGLTLNDGAVFNYVLGTTSDRFTLTGGALTGASTLGSLTINLSAGTGFAAGNYTLFDFTSAGSVTGFDLSDFTLGTQISGYTSSLSISGSTLILTASAIPEPSTYAAILAGASLVGAVIYRRRQARVRA